MAGFFILMGYSIVTLIVVNNSTDSGDQMKYVEKIFEGNKVAFNDDESLKKVIYSCGQCNSYYIQIHEKLKEQIYKYYPKHTKELNKIFKGVYSFKKCKTKPWMVLHFMDVSINLYF